MSQICFISSLPINLLVLSLLEFCCYTEQRHSTHAEVMARYRSCPAVSQICAFIVFPSTWMLLVANSTPMVLLLSRLNSLRVKRDRRLLFPTPESPINTTKRKNIIFKIKSSYQHLHSAVVLPRCYVASQAGPRGAAQPDKHRRKLCSQHLRLYYSQLASPAPKQPQAFLLLAAAQFLRDGNEKLLQGLSAATHCFGGPKPLQVIRGN